MSSATSTYAVDNSKVYPVTIQTKCKRIQVQEDYDSATPPTADLIQYIPFDSTTPVKVPMGTPAVFTTPTWFIPGQVAGGIKTRAGSITVQQVEGV